MRAKAALVAIWLAGSPAVLADERISGFELMSPELQAMQTDELANPAMLWVGEGEELWRTPAGAAGRSCADCHGEAGETMRGVAARYPAMDDASGRPVDLGGRIALCQARHQAAEPLAPESEPLLSLMAFIGRQSRGLPISPPDDPRLLPFRAQGEALFEERMGQLDFACSQCHDDHWGRRLAGSVIPQGHPTGYPIYRLEWQGMGGLQRRLRNCLTGVRALPFAYGSDEFVALELHLMDRARGLAIETPAVRP